MRPDTDYIVVSRFRAKMLALLFAGLGSLLGAGGMYDHIHRKLGRESVVVEKADIPLGGNVEVYRAEDGTIGMLTTYPLPWQE